MSTYCEILALIVDLGLEPRNIYACEYCIALELDEVRRSRIQCDLRALSARNHNRKNGVSNVLTPKSDCLQIPFESEL